MSQLCLYAPPHLYYLIVYQYNEKIRLGRERDGGYVIADNVGDYDCYLSAGVSIEESFSKDFIIKYNMNKNNCFAFDLSVEDYPYEYTKDITFIKINIGPENTDETTTLKEYNAKYNNIFLKMDIEGCEVEWLESLNESDLKHYKQIAIEFHGINDDSYNRTYIRKFECFKKLSSTHFLIHAHGNNWSGNSFINYTHVPDVIELTYIRKDTLINPVFNTLPLPMESIDFKNNIDNPEINLNHPPFRF